MPHSTHLAQPPCCGYSSSHHCHTLLLPLLPLPATSQHIPALQLRLCCYSRCYSPSTSATAARRTLGPQHRVADHTCLLQLLQVLNIAAAAAAPAAVALSVKDSCCCHCLRCCCCCCCLTALRGCLDVVSHVGGQLLNHCEHASRTRRRRGRGQGSMDQHTFSPPLSFILFRLILFMKVHSPTRSRAAHKRKTKCWPLSRAESSCCHATITTVSHQQ